MNLRVVRAILPCSPPLLIDPPSGDKLTRWVPFRDCNAAGMKSSRLAAAFYLPQRPLARPNQER